MPNADSPTNPSDVVIAARREKLKAAAVVVVAEADTVAAVVDTAAVAADMVAAAVVDMAADVRNAKCTKPPVRHAAHRPRFHSNPRKVAPSFVAIAFDRVATNSADTRRKTRSPNHSRPVNHQWPGIVRLCAAIAIVFCACTAHAISPDLLEVVPRDHLAFVVFDNSAIEGAADSTTHVTPLVSLGADVLHRFGGQRANQSAVSATLDILSTLAKLEPYPFAVVVTDASAKRMGPDSFRLSGMQAAVIVATHGNNAPITQYIQDLLTRWTSRDSARITNQEEHGTKVFTLIDDRLPDWCVVKWGSIKDFYVVALGDRGFNDAAQSILRANEDATENSRHKRWQELLDSRSAHFELQINFDAISNALSTVVKGRTQDVIDELGFANCQRSMWTVAKKNRAVVWSQLKIEDGNEVFVPISTEARGVQSRLIPATATEYTLFRCGMDDILNRAAEAYLASRRDEFRADLRSRWTRFETDAGISIQTGLFDHLGEIILIHDDPPHPLKLPLLSTIVIPIAGEPAIVDQTLAALLKQSNRWFNKTNANPGDDAPVFAPQFTKADDNVWYLSFGFAGPAITVANRFIVISHSPLACRHARDFLLAKTPPQSESNAE